MLKSHRCSGERRNSEPICCHRSKREEGKVSFERSCVSAQSTLKGTMLGSPWEARGKQAETVSVENSPGARQAEGGEQAADGGS